VNFEVVRCRALAAQAMFLAAAVEVAAPEPAARTLAVRALWWRHCLVLMPDDLRLQYSGIAGCLIFSATI
jgi:hypothetical protein